MLHYSLSFSIFFQEPKKVVTNCEKRSSVEVARQNIEVTLQNKERLELRFISRLIQRFNHKLTHQLSAKMDSFEAILLEFKPYANGSTLATVEEKIRLFRHLILNNYEHFQEDAACLYLVYKYHESLFSYGVVTNGPMQRANECLLRAVALGYPEAMSTLAKHILRGELYSLTNEALIWAWNYENKSFRAQSRSINVTRDLAQNPSQHEALLRVINKSHKPRFDGDIKLPLNTLFAEACCESIYPFKM